MDFTQLALAHSVADIAVSAFVLRFLPDPGAALREQRLELASGGVAGVVVWGRGLRLGARRLLDKVFDEHEAARYTGGSVLTDDRSLPESLSHPRWANSLGRVRHSHRMMAGAGLLRRHRIAFGTHDGYRLSCPVGSRGAGRGSAAHRGSRATPTGSRDSRCAPPHRTGWTPAAVPW